MCCQSRYRLPNVWRAVGGCCLRSHACGGFHVADTAEKLRHGETQSKTRYLRTANRKRNQLGWQLQIF